MLLHAPMSSFFEIKQISTILKEKLPRPSPPPQ